MRRCVVLKGQNVMRCGAFLNPPSESFESNPVRVFLLGGGGDGDFFGIRVTCWFFLQNGGSRWPAIPGIQEVDSGIQEVDCTRQSNFVKPKPYIRHKYSNEKPSHTYVCCKRTLKVPVE